MASSVPRNPDSRDGSKSSRSSGNRSGESRFFWVSSSPSPAEVAELEVQFPEVIQVPSAALEAESSGWEDRAILARSFNRWVPPEAILREFRRAGIAGEIEALCLAQRCYIFKFADHNAKEVALGRPWIVNGQIIATEVWSPEFVPAADSVAMALLWVRLPNLPLEFWSEEILSSILAPTGLFVATDSATKDRSRGGFARACVRVDLRRSLRPGIRVRGSRTPFWQQYVYEQLDGICPRCGSLHLSGSCSSVPESEPSSDGSMFGPWMAALRQPRSSQGPSSVRSGNPSSGSAPAASSVPAEGWRVPAKMARRRPGNNPLALQPPVFNASTSGKTPATVPSRVSEGMERAVSVILSPETGNGSQAESSKVQISLNSPLCNMNPFALLGTDELLGQPSIEKLALPGSSKRARPVENPVQRVSSKKDKRKGKVISTGANKGQNEFIFSAASDSNRGPAVQIAKAAKLSIALGVSPVGVDGAFDPQSPLRSLSHEAVVSSLKEVISGQGQELQFLTQPPLVVETGVGMDVTHVTGSDTSLSECPPDADMSEGKSGALPPPSV